jgi:hypothetical protein
VKVAWDNVVMVVYAMSMMGRRAAVTRYSPPCGGRAVGRTPNSGARTRPQRVIDPPVISDVSKRGVGRPGSQVMGW